MKLLKASLAIILLNGYLNAMEIIGKVKVKGSSPHTYLVIEDIKTHKNYAISNAKDFSLINRQNETLKFEVKVIKKAVGPGFPAVVEIIYINTQN